MGGAAVLPATAAAVVAHAAGDLRIQDIPVHVPAADEAVIEVAFGGICGSDVHYWMHGAAGESVLKAPMILGHEIVGTVIRAAADKQARGRRPARTSRCIPPLRVRARRVIRRTGPTCHRAARIWAVPHAFRTPTVRSAGM